MSYTIGLLIEEPSLNDRIAFEEFNSLSDASHIDEQPHPTFVALHAELTSRFPCICDLPDDKVDDGVWSDGPLINNFGARQAVVGVMFSHVEAVLPFIIHVSRKHGITVFDWQTETVHRPSDVVLTVEGEPELRNPAVQELEAVIERLTPAGGPSFAVLESVRGYVQTAGGDGFFTVEWRQAHGETFHHFVAGKDGAADTEVEILANGFQVTVNENECLTTQDVRALFQTFHGAGSRPSNFVWRDVTDRFA